MGACPERIWPGYNWNDYSVVFGDAGQSKHFLVSGGKVVEVPASELPSHLFRSSYAFFEENGRSGLALSASSYGKLLGSNDPKTLLPALIRLAAHEAFHGRGQKSWRPRAGTRGTAIPIRWEPRLYRELAYLHLRAAYLHSRSEAVPRAAYWIGRWANEFPSELASTTDGYEGTASFAENATFALLQAGCQASDAEIDRELLRQVRLEFPDTMSDGRPSLDGEGYLLGSHAAFLLRASGNTAWYEAMKSGDTPVEYLLRETPAVPEAMPEALVAAVKKNAAEEQKRVEELLGDAYRVLDSPDLLVVSVPIAWYRGSYSPGGFFFDETRAIGLSPLARGIAFNAPNGFSFQAGRGAVKVNDSASPCHGWSFVASRAWLSTNGAELNMSGLQLSGRLRGALRKGPGGRDWFCAE